MFGLRKPETKLEAIKERATIGSVRVNRELGVIHGVRVIGRHSKNNRVYTEQALRNAIPMYEGVGVYVDHRRGDGERSYRDKIAALRGVHYEREGLVANMHVNKGHALAEQLLHDAENAPDQVGLSHDASGETSGLPDGRRQVESISQVNSVDLVTNPASTNGLFESKRGGMPSGSAFVRALTEQMEADGMMPADSGETPVGDGEPIPNMEQVAAILADDSLDDAGKVAALKTLLEDGTAPESPADTAATEALRQQVGNLQERIEAAERRNRRLTEALKETPLSGSRGVERAPGSYHERVEVPTGDAFLEAISAGMPPRYKGDRRQRPAWMEG